MAEEPESDPAGDPADRSPDGRADAESGESDDSVGADDGEGAPDSGAPAPADDEDVTADADSAGPADGENSTDAEASADAGADGAGGAEADGDPPDDAAETDATAEPDGAGGVAPETTAGESATDDEPIATYDSEDLAEVAPDIDLGDEGPESDEEMPLTVHIEEMMRRLSVVVLVVVLVMVVVYPFAAEVVNYLWNAHIPGAATVEGRRPRIYGPLEFVLTKLKVAGLAGFVVGLPVFVYETYLFMRPGLFPHERRYYLAAVPTSLVLALVGITFAHFAVLPAIFAYFTSYTVNSGTVVAFGLRETFNLILLLMGYMAVVFQIPLFIQLAIMMDLTSRRWLEDRRLLFWGSFLGLAFLVSPDPTGMAPIIIAATMIVLFEGTLGLLRWTGN